jgi:molecular chaperone Hsp33
MAKVSPALNDRWVRCISTSGTVRGVAIDATGLLQYLVEIHSVADVYVAQRLGEAVMGALMVASYCKPGERVNLNVRGNGEIKQALVDALPNGTVRGYVIRQATDFSGASRNFGPWGDGLLSVLRAKENLAPSTSSGYEQPYIGTVPLVTGHLAKDLTFYWYQSEQVPSAVGLSVRAEEAAGKVRIRAAGGFLVQALPGASDAELRQIEEHVQKMQSMTASLESGMNPVHLLSQIFQSLAFMILEEAPLKMECHCSRERVEGALKLAGREEIETILNTQGQAEVSCDFCSTDYRFGAEELRSLLARF